MQIKRRMIRMIRMILNEMRHNSAHEADLVESGEERASESSKGVSFEDVVFHIMSGDILDTIDHPNQERYSGQQIHAVAIKEYVYLVPFVESEDEVFLKTIIPSRKATKIYRGSNR